MAETTFKAEASAGVYAVVVIGLPGSAVTFEAEMDRHAARAAWIWGSG